MITWDFKSPYKSIWIFKVLIVWSFQWDDQLECLSIGFYPDYENCKWQWNIKG
jgi:hypothetical protein